MKYAIFSYLYHLHDEEFATIFLVSDQLFANTPLFQVKMKQLTRNVSSIIYDNEKHDPIYPETYLCVGSLCHSDATNELADRFRHMISVKLERRNRTDRVNCRLGQWENWMFSTVLPKVTTE